MRRHSTSFHSIRKTKGTNSVVRAGNARRLSPQSRRAHSNQRSSAEPFSPPETWHATHGKGNGYKIIRQAPGEGYRHVVTPEDVRNRLAQLPAHFTRELEVVQLSGMTRKKQSFPCYGMQWGSTLYLYPLEESLTEYFYAPPPTGFYNEARMYGGVWNEDEPGVWTLEWSEEAIRDFYLNNILIHELGHLLDNRNTNYTDRERYAEWFAVQFGYRATGGIEGRLPDREVRRRHHAKR